MGGLCDPVEAPGSVRSRSLAIGRRRQGHLDLQWAEQRRLGRDRRHRHLLGRQRRLYGRARPAGAAGLPRPHPARAPRGADQLLDRGGDQPGAHRPRRARRRGPAAHERAVGDGGLRARPARRAGGRQGSGARHHLRRRHALSPGRDRRALQRLLLPDRVIGARLPGALEARLSPSVGLARRGGLRGPLARRRPQRPLQLRGSADARGALPAGPPAARHDARDRPRRDRDHHGGRGLASARLAGLARQSRPRPGRLPVRHAAAPDPREPDLRRLETPPARPATKATSCSTASARPGSTRPPSATTSCRIWRRARPARSRSPRPPMPRAA